MRFLHALAWFALLAAALRFLVVTVELARIKNPIHYLLLEGRAKSTQQRAFLVACVAVLWLLFGGRV